MRWCRGEKASRRLEGETRAGGLERTGNPLLTDHQEVHQHEHRQKPWQHKGVETVETGQRRLADPLATTKQLHQLVANHGNGSGHTGDDLHSPVSHLIPGQRVPRDPKADGNDRHGDTHHPGEFPGSLEAPRQVDPEYVKDQHQHHHRGAPAMHGADEPAEVHRVHQVLNGVEGLSHRGPVIKRHGKPRGELNQEAHKGDAAQAIEDIDVGRNILGGEVVCDLLDLQALLEPVVNLRHGAKGFSG